MNFSHVNLTPFTAFHKPCWKFSVVFWGAKTNKDLGKTKKIYIKSNICIDKRDKTLLIMSKMFCFDILSCLFVCSEIFSFYRYK